MNINPLLCIDFYKADHRRQYPEGTTMVYSNFTARSTRLAPLFRENYDDKIVFVGLQAIIKWFIMDCWNDNFFNRDKVTVVSEYKEFMDSTLGPDAIPVDHIESLHDLGYMPIEIRALKEGSRVNVRVPMWTIHNTHPEFFWLTNYLETILSNLCWKSCTAATIAYQYRKMFDVYARITGAPSEFCQWQGHDFSARGMSGIHDMCMSGLGHLCCFTGTDTAHAIKYAMDYYHTDPGELVGGSIYATEHSVACMGSKYGEDGASDFEYFANMINKVYPSGMVSLVADTFDFWRAVTEYLPKLAQDIMQRDGKVVIRPDSGDPVKIICGDPEAEKGTPEHKGAIECLWETFGGTVGQGGDGNDYKTLDSHIGLIYGDSITLERQEQILRGLADKGFSSANVVLGIGSFTYEYLTRDSFGFAVKATYGEIDHKGVEIYKDPKTDSGMKKSARGLLKVVKDNEWDFHLIDGCKDIEGAEGAVNELELVFRDGTWHRQQSLEGIRTLLQCS